MGTPKSTRMTQSGDVTVFGRLVPTFRSSYTISAITFYELRKAMGTSKFMIRVPLFDLKSLGSFRRLRCRDFKSAALVTLGGHFADRENNSDPSGVIVMQSSRPKLIYYSRLSGLIHASARVHHSYRGHSGSLAVFGERATAVQARGQDRIAHWLRRA